MSTSMVYKLVDITLRDEADGCALEVEIDGVAYRLWTDGYDADDAGEYAGLYINGSNGYSTGIYQGYINGSLCAGTLSVTGIIKYGDFTFSYEAKLASKTVEIRRLS
jgi:hypothetical protein